MARFIPFLLAFFSIGAVLNTSSQTISGKVVDQNAKGLSALGVDLYMDHLIYKTQTDQNGGFSITGLTTGLSPNSLPKDYIVSEFSPNPFSSATNIQVQVPVECRLQIAIFNNLGQSVNKSIQKRLSRGNNQVEIKLDNVPVGSYLCRLLINDRYSVVKKMIVTKGASLSNGNNNQDYQTNYPFNSLKSGLASKIDSIVVTGALFNKAVFKDLPLYTGGNLDIGNLNINISYGLGVYSQDISSSGGVFVISGVNDSINGISISVPANSFQGTHNFKIYAEALPSTIDTTVAKPLSHLICINTDIGYSDSLINISVPINLSADGFAMGFYYDPVTNQLEAIPTIKSEQNIILLALPRFNNLQATKSKNIFESVKLVILELNLDKLPSYITEFLPEKDGWDFPNAGSEPEQEGMCTGMSITALWYYTEKVVKKNEKHLYGSFDKLDNIWYDNPIGIRFTSYIQRLTMLNLFNVKTQNNWDVRNYYDIISAINLQKQPVLLGLYNPENKKGHALVAFGYNVIAGDIYVYDPNLPKVRCTVHYNPLTGFAIYDNGYGSYSKIFFIGNSILINYSLLNLFWITKEKKPDVIFPYYQLTYQYNGKQTPINKDTLWLDAASAHINLKIEEAYPSAIKVIDYKGSKVLVDSSMSSSLSFSLDCKSIYNTFGFMILGKPVVSYSFIDFKWVTFKQEQYSIANVSAISQSGTLGKALSDSIKVIVKDALENPFKDAVVDFLANNNGSVSPSKVSTDTNGIAKVKWTLGDADTAQTLTVKAFKNDNTTQLLGSPLKFNASASGGAYSIEIFSGNNQPASIGKPLSEPIQVIVKDIDGKPFSGAIVNFQTNASGSVSPSQVITGPDGIAGATWILGVYYGPDDQIVSATALKSDNVTPLQGSPITFNIKPTPPSVRTDAVTEITATSARISCFVTDLGSSSRIGAGTQFCDSSGTWLYVGENNWTGCCSYVGGVYGLTPNTTYSVRACAWTPAGQGFGNVLSFTTLPEGKR